MVLVTMLILLRYISGSITSILIVSSATGEMVFPLLVGKVI